MADTRDECRGCIGALEWLGERLSVLCRWLWGWLDAHSDLDDEREAQEIAEARAAQRRLIARVEAAMRDGRITAAERAECMTLAQVADAELADVEAYDAFENERHARADHCATRARAVVAPLSRGADRRQAAAATANGGLTEPVWPEMIVQAMAIRE